MLHNLFFDTVVFLSLWTKW